jgi:hypothetical protein
MNHNCVYAKAGIIHMIAPLKVHNDSIGAPLIQQRLYRDLVTPAAVNIIVAENLLPLEHKGNGTGGTQKLLDCLLIIIVEAETLRLFSIDIQTCGIQLFSEAGKLAEIQLIHDFIKAFPAEDSS